MNEPKSSIESCGTLRVPFEVSVRVNDSSQYIDVTTRDLSPTGLSFISSTAMKGRIKILMGNLYNCHTIDAEVAFCRRYDVSGIGQYLVGCQFIDRQPERCGTDATAEDVDDAMRTIEARRIPDPV